MINEDQFLESSNRKNGHLMST